MIFLRVLEPFPGANKIPDTAPMVIPANVPNATTLNFLIIEICFRPHQPPQKGGL